MFGLCGVITDAVILWGVVYWMEQPLNHTYKVSEISRHAVYIYTSEDSIAWQFWEKSVMLFILTALKLKSGCSVPKKCVLLFTSVVKFWFSYCCYIWNWKFVDGILSYILQHYKRNHGMLHMLKFYIILNLV